MGYSEVCRNAQKCYELNFPGTPALGSLFDAEWPRCDLVCMGFPCQPFSVRGQTPGLSDERGQLFRELVRLLTACQPSAFLFENVAGLVVRTRLKISFAVLYVRLCVLIVWQIIDGGHRTRHPDNKGGSRQRTEGPTDVFSEGPTFRHIIAAFVRPFVA